MTVPTLHLEFGTRRRPVSPLGLVGLAAAVALLGWVAVMAGEALSQRAAQQKEIEALAERSNAPPPRAPSTEKPDPKVAAQAQFARETVRNLNTPWADLLNALEKAPSNVALLVVEPSAAKRSLSVTAEAASAKEMLDYIGALQTDGRLTNVALVTHQLQAQAPGTPLRFQLRANWGETP